MAARKELKGPDELDKIRVESAMKESALMKIWDAKAAEMYLGASRVKQPSKSAESAMRAISLFDRVGNTAAAIQACDRFLDAGVRDPRVSRVLLLKGQQMLKLGLGADAIAAFEENIERYPNTPYSYQSLLGIGDAHAVLGETDLALFAYERIRTKDTRFDPRTPIWRGALYREGVLQVFHGLADPAGKKAALRQGISLLAGYSERYPTQALVRRADFYRALGLMGLGEWTRANEVFARLAETRVELEDPDREERLRIYMLSNYLHGIAYLQVMRRATPPAGPREWDTAIDILETAIERFGETPQSVWASSQLVVLYHQAGKDPQATKVGRKALWLANRVGTKPGFDSAFWTRWVQWKMAVLLPGANKQ